MHKVLQKTANKEELTKKDIKQLLTYLGIKPSLLIKVSYVLNFFIVIVLCSLALGFIGNIDYTKFKYAILLPIGYVVIIVVVYAFIISYKKSIESYYEVIDDLYKEKLNEYEGYSIVITPYFVSPNSILQKKEAIVICDGYSFIIYEDFLLPTPYMMKHIKKTDKRPAVLKIIDSSSINKKPEIVKFEDIESYKGVLDKKAGVEYDYQLFDYHHIMPPSAFNRFVEIIFKDGTKMKLGYNVLEMLRNSIPLLEAKDE